MRGNLLGDNIANEWKGGKKAPSAPKGVPHSLVPVLTDLFDPQREFLALLRLNFLLLRREKSFPWKISPPF